MSAGSGCVNPNIDNINTIVGTDVKQRECIEIAPLHLFTYTAFVYIGC